MLLRNVCLCYWLLLLSHPRLRFYQVRQPKQPSPVEFSARKSGLLSFAEGTESSPISASPIAHTLKIACHMVTAFKNTEVQN